jgi:hypothetical protein
MGDDPKLLALARRVVDFRGAGQRHPACRLALRPRQPTTKETE